MVDVLIRDIPADVIDRIDSAAQGAGQTRAEYLRHHIGGLVTGGETAVTLADLDRFRGSGTQQDDHLR